MGLFKKSKQQVSETPKLLCQSGDAGSYKCVFLASYRKLPVDIEWQESSALDEKMSESLNMSGLQRFPCIKDGDFTICGTNAVLTYLNIKGRSPTIHPRKARVLAMQQYWIQVLTSKFVPLLNEFSTNKKDIASVLEIFDKNLEDKNYIVGEFSLADIHWSAEFKVLEKEGHSDIISSCKNITNWLTKIKAEIPGYDIKNEEVAA